MACEFHRLFFYYIKQVKMTSLRFKYNTYEFDNSDIHLRTLRNSQEFEDSNDIAKNLGIHEGTWSLFGVLWPSGEVLARIMFNKKIEGLSILEVGCGIGLPSLILNQRMANITASDSHPLSNSFLNINSDLNQDKRIPFHTCDWKNNTEPIGRFDLIIGSDLLYQRDHCQLLADFINKNSKNKCEVLIVDPGRGNLSNFKKEMIKNGFSLTVSRFQEQDTLEEPYLGQIVTFVR